MEPISADNYDVVNGSLTFLPNNNSEDNVELCNFNAVIYKENILTDGVTTERTFSIKGRLKDGTALDDVEVNFNDFDSLKWVNMYWSTAIISPVPGSKKHIPAAMRYLRLDSEKINVVKHTGWVSNGESHCYMTSAGPIGTGCGETAFDVLIEHSSLSNVSIIKIDGDEARIRDTRASIDLMNMNPSAVMLPLMGATYLAPLGDFLPLDFSVFLYGTSGSFKSQLTMLCQSHYGRGFHNTLPGNWTSTENALEQMAFVAKDALFVIDDFTFLRNETASSGFKALESKAERIFRGQGNSAGRQRMSGNGVKANYHSRAMILTSGETLPQATSLLARMLILRLKKEDISSKALTVMQGYAQSGVFENAMHGYIQWISNNYDDLKNSIPGLLDAYRTKFSSLRDVHARTPDNVAKIFIGLEFFGWYAHDIGAISDTEYAELLDRVFNVLMEAGNNQRETFKYDDKVQDFVDALNDALTNGHAHLEFLDQGGFDECTFKKLIGWDRHQDGWRSNGTCIGWVEGASLYFLPRLGYDCVHELARSKGVTLDTQRHLFEKLKEREFMIDSEAKRFTVRKNINKRNQHVVKLDLNKCIPGVVGNLKCVQIAA